jgi:hypothetical protein
MLISQLDTLYVTLLSALTTAINENHLLADGTTLDNLLDIIAPRLSRARSQAVPKAFKSFWQNCFAELHASEMTKDALAFVRDVLAAVPGMISVKGFDSESSMSEVSL